MIVERVLSLPEAYAMAGALRAEGIAAEVLDANLGQTNWMLQNALGGFRIDVPARDLEDASTIIRDLPAKPVSEDDVSWGTIVPVWKKWAAALVVLLVG